MEGGYFLIVTQTSMEVSQDKSTSDNFIQFYQILRLLFCVVLNTSEVDSWETRYKKLKKSYQVTVPD